MINCNVYERLFKRLDEDGDGKLSPSELQRCVGTIGEELLLEEVRQVVESMDTDGNGFLGFEKETGDKMEELREAFRIYELDGSGSITPKSLQKMLSRLGESRSVEDCCVMIGQFDVNGDGVLSFDEFKLMMLWKNLYLCKSGFFNFYINLSNK